MLLKLVVSICLPSLLLGMVISCEMDQRFALASMEDRLKAATVDLQTLDAKAKQPNAGLVGLRDVLYQQLQKFGLARTDLFDLH